MADNGEERDLSEYWKWFASTDYTFIFKTNQGKYKMSLKDPDDIKQQVERYMHMPIDFANPSKTYEIDAPDLKIEILE